MGMATRTSTQAQVLCVDLDRTLIDSDLLWEAIARFLARNPFRVFTVFLTLLRGKSYLKRRLAERVAIDFELLPYKSDVVDLVRAARGRGEPTVLVTASPEAYAVQVAGSLQIFDTVLATGAGTGNLSGGTKAQLLVDRYGERGFAYVGDSRRDLAVWRHANKAIAVDAASSVIGRLASLGIEYEQVRTRTFSLRSWARQLRLHQAVKNLLVFVPVIVTLKERSPTGFAVSSVMFAAFCLLSFAIYIWNDLGDLDADRAHPTKRYRPLASGAIPIPHAMVASVVLAACALVLASSINLMAVGVLLLYLVVTVSYSAYFKRVAIADVIILAGLYTVRVLAGCAALVVRPSVWLILFCVFIFFSLALMKRSAEMANTVEISGNGRGYLPADKEILLTLGVASGVVSVMVFGLYIHSLNAGLQYRAPELLWLAVPVLLFWISRAWLLTNRGNMHDDPVIFAFKDRLSLATGLVMALITVAAMVVPL